MLFVVVVHGLTTGGGRGGTGPYRAESGPAPERVRIGRWVERESRTKARLLERRSQAEDANPVADALACDTVPAPDMVLSEV